MEQAVFLVVLTVRFVLPFTILRYPLPGVVACLVVDGVDQTVFQTFGFDPPFYQSYDKAMDVFYLAVAYIATLRNWVSMPAFGVSRFLFFYRQIGVVAFELTQVRALLLVFPNTFEYFFIAYETIRARWQTLRYSLRFWVLLAAAIWIFVKLPQEYWIHVAQLDFTDTWKDVPWFAPTIVVGALVLLAVAWFVVRPRLDPADHSWQLVAPPLPDAMDDAKERAAHMAQHGRVWSVASLEKTFLIGLLLIIFAEVLPAMSVSTLRVLGWVGVFVLLNAVLSIWVATHGWSIESVMTTLVARLLVNGLLLLVIDRVFFEGLRLGDALFLLLLFSVLLTLYDRYRPVHEYRAHEASSDRDLGLS